MRVSAVRDSLLTLWVSEAVPGLQRMPPNQLNLVYFFPTCIFPVSARTEADKQVSVHANIPDISMCIRYVQLRVRDLFWLSSLCSAKSCRVTSAESKC